MTDGKLLFFDFAERFDAELACAHSSHTQANFWSDCCSQFRAVQVCMTPSYLLHLVLPPHVLNVLQQVTENNPLLMAQLPQSPFIPVYRNDVLIITECKHYDIFFNRGDLKCWIIFRGYRTRPKHQSDLWFFTFLSNVPSLKNLIMTSWIAVVLLSWYTLWFVLFSDWRLWARKSELTYSCCSTLAVPLSALFPNGISMYASVPSWHLFVTHLSHLLFLRSHSLTSIST